MIYSRTALLAAIALSGVNAFSPSSPSSVSVSNSKENCSLAHLGFQAAVECGLASATIM